MEGPDETKEIYKLIIARTVELMRPEFDREGVPTSVLEQMKDSWQRHLEKSMQPAKNEVHLFRNMTGLANPAPSYKQPYWSRETHPRVTVVSEPAPQPKPAAVPPPATVQEPDDPVAAMFETLKRQQEERKEPEVKQRPEEDDLAHVSDDETNQESPVETDFMCGLYTKINRSKTRWKLVLNNCILNILGREILLRQVSGNMEFQ